MHFGQAQLKLWIEVRGLRQKHFAAELRVAPHKITAWVANGEIPTRLMRESIALRTNRGSMPEDWDKEYVRPPEPVYDEVVRAIETMPETS